MQTDEFLKLLAVSVALSTALVGGIFMLLGARLKARYDADLESHKASLKAQGDLALEQLKSTLAISAVQKNATFAELTQRRFDAIAAVHGPLLAFQRTVATYVSPLELNGAPSKDERAKDVAEAHRIFLEEFAKHRIFLSKSSADLIDKIEQGLRGSANVFMFTVHIAQKSPAGIDSNSWLKVVERVEGEIAMALLQLETELRGIMGEELQ